VKQISTNQHTSKNNRRKTPWFFSKGDEREQALIEPWGLEGLPSMLSFLGEAGSGQVTPPSLGWQFWRPKIKGWALRFPRLLACGVV
jgi:hypothetical protein